MILLLDIGNTRLKWLLLSSNSHNKILSAKKGSVLLSVFKSSKKNSVKNNVFFEEITTNINQIRADGRTGNSLEEGHLKQIVWICVCPKFLEKKIQPVLNELSGEKHSKKITTPKNGEFKFERDWGKVILRCNYDRPIELGADRWAALVALAYLGPPVNASPKKITEIILISAGTATVIDRVFWSGFSEKSWLCEHKGGIIFPGFSQMQNDMKFLKKSRNKKNSTLDVHPQNTLDAIRTGIASCQVGFQPSVHGTIVVHGGESRKWIESYKFFYPMRSKPLELPWLVFEGLFIISNKKEKKF